MPSLLTEPPRPTAIRDSPRAHWYVVATVCVGAFMGQLDASIVTIALPGIGRDLHASVGAAEWVALAYLLVLIATVATVGHLADAIGRKLLYTYGFGVFTAGSALSGLATSLPVLIGARGLQALGAAMLQANSIALITEATPRPLLRRAVGLQGTAQALGLALGPAVGGALLALGSWRLIFLINLPAGAVGLVLSRALLPRSRSRRDIHERRARVPLISLHMARTKALAVGLPSALVSFTLLFAVLFALPYHLAEDHVRSTLAGLELALLPVGIGLTAACSGGLRSGALIPGGMLLTGSGLMAIAFAGASAPLLLAGLLMAGVGLGAFIPSNNASIMAAAPHGHTGLVSGLLNMTRGAGTALGVASAGALYEAGGLTLAMAALGGVGLVAGLWLHLNDLRE